MWNMLKGKETLPLKCIPLMSLSLSHNKWNLIFSVKRESPPVAPGTETLSYPHLLLQFTCQQVQPGWGGGGRSPTCKLSCCCSPARLESVVIGRKLWSTPTFLSTKYIHLMCPRAAHLCDERRRQGLPQVAVLEGHSR